jgi:LysR family hydrogen peroxide-inducible transcriptional activator
MELTHLRYFQTVAQESSFTKASLILRVQQPAISKAIQILESELNLKLLDRNKRSVKLTSEGAEVLKICVRIFDEVAGIKNINAKKGSEKLSGALSFGASDAVAISLIPNYLKPFLKLHPLVKPSVFSGTSAAITDEVLNGTLEFGIFFTEPETASFEVTTIREVPFLLVAKTGYTSIEKPKGSFITSRDEDYSARKSSPVRRLLNQAQLNLSSAIVANNLEVQKQMVLKGMGFALLPEFFVSAEVKKHQLDVLYPAKKFTYPLRLVKRKGRGTSLAAEAFIKAIQAEGIKG